MSATELVLGLEGRASSYGNERVEVRPGSLKHLGERQNLFLWACRPTAAPRSVLEQGRLGPGCLFRPSPARTARNSSGERARISAVSRRRCSLIIVGHESRDGQGSPVVKVLPSSRLRIPCSVSGRATSRPSMSCRGSDARAPSQSESEILIALKRCGSPETRGPSVLGKPKMIAAAGVRLTPQIGLLRSWTTAIPLPCCSSCAARTSAPSCRW